MVKAKLGITTCDKCGGPLEKGERAIVIAEGDIVPDREMVIFHGDGVTYACHFACWDGHEDTFFTDQEHLRKESNAYQMNLFFFLRSTNRHSRI
jgi:hypothetical protein